jgi:hypothetical protein
MGGKGGGIFLCGPLKKPAWENRFFRAIGLGGPHGKIDFPMRAIASPLVPLQPTASDDGGEG